MLEGNLSEYPLRELLTILAGNRETGRLELNLEPAAGNLYLAKGKVVDARVGPLQGLSAVNVIVAAEEVGFKFQRLDVPPEPAFNENEQALLAVVIGVDDANGLPESTPLLPPVQRRPLFASLTEEEDIDDGAASSESEPELIPVLRRLQVVPERRWLPPKDVAVGLALSATQQTLRYVQRHNLAFAVVVVLFIVPAIIAITVRLGVNNSSAGPHSVAQGAEPASTANEPAALKPNVGLVTPPVATEKNFGLILPGELRAQRLDSDKSTTEKHKQVISEKPKSTTPKREERVEKKEETRSDPNKNLADTYSIVVTAKIENGHVTEAAVANHRAGLDAYEATAIRLAQQRRFPKDKTGTERMVLTVSK